MKKFYAFLFIILLGLSPVPAPANAAEQPEIIISEINWAGSAISRADEWIELYNPTSEDVDIGGWILTGSATSGEAILIADDIVIKAESTLVIANYNLTSKKTTLNFDANLVTSSLSLSNSSFEILLTTPEGLVVDEATLQAGSSVDFTSQERNLETLEWRTTEISMNLSDDLQMGTPGWVEMPVEIIEDVEETEEDMLVWCKQYLEELEQETSETETTEEIEEEIINDPVEETDSNSSQGTEEEEEEEEILDEETSIIIVHFDMEDILINEIVSDPIDSIEWIELFNPGTEAIDLAGWTIEDRTGRDTTLEGFILPEGFVVIENPNGRLNNDGDDVILKDPNGQIIHEVSYDETPPEKEESFARTDDNVWALTSIMTPGQKNIFPEVLGVVEIIEEDDNISDEEIVLSEVNEDDETEISKIHTIVAVANAPDYTKETASTVSTASNEKSDDKITVTGTLTALPGTFSRQTAFIDGMQIYFYHADWPDLALGDVLHISGEASSNRGEPRIKVVTSKDIVVTDHTDLIPESILISSLSTENEGKLVTLNGKMLNREGDKMQFTDDTGEILIVSHANSGIRWTQLNGVNLSVTGIVRIIEGEIRIYPRYMEDVKDLPVETQKDETNDNLIISSTKNTAPWVGGGLIFGSSVVLGYWYLREKKRQGLLSLNTKLSQRKQTA